MLRFAQSPRINVRLCENFTQSDVPGKYASARRFIARLASEILLSSVCEENRFKSLDVPSVS
jgi:hypothetical protein